VSLASAGYMVSSIGFRCGNCKFFKLVPAAELGVSPLSGGLLGYCHNDEVNHANASRGLPDQTEVDAGHGCCNEFQPTNKPLFDAKRGPRRG